jgi:5-methylcytosine-specific restriction endonuclease McrA
MKKCKKCNVTKPVTEYYKNKTYSDGVASTCKSCKREYQSRWREENREDHRAYSKGYYREHKEERAKYYSAWRRDNFEVTQEYQKEWRLNNPDRMKARRKVENARRRALLENAKGDYTVDEWLELKDYYGCICLACGRSEPEVKITPDHVIPLAKGGSNSIENIQPLCWGCNATKQARIKDYRAENNYQFSETA